MPLYNVQKEALLAIAKNRHPGSHIAGGTAINLNGVRYSKDIDIFHDLSSDKDRIVKLSDTVEKDISSLESEGFNLDWQIRGPEFYRAVITKDNDSTVLEWVIDSDFRFFDTIPDETFGYRLHMFDLATNKVLAAASRKEPRDVLDILHINDKYYPLEAIVWAAPAKDPGYTPESLIEDLRRNCRYQQADYDMVSSDQVVDARSVSLALKVLFHKTEEFVASMPNGYEAMAFLEDGSPVKPIVDRLQSYDKISAERHAHWPSSSEIDSEMIGSDRKL